MRALTADSSTLLRGEVIVLAFDDRAYRLQGQEALVLQLAYELDALQVLLAIEGHVAPLLESRRHQPLLDVEVDDLTLEAREITQILHPVRVAFPIDLRRGGSARALAVVHASTSTSQGVSGRPTHPSTKPCCRSSSLRQFGSSITISPLISLTLQRPQPPIAHE